MGSWRFLNTGAADGATNMAIDEALLSGVEAGTSPPTVRVYAWEPPTVSIGYSQKASDELDLIKCESWGFGVVRRPTGGRAVLHAGELTYSVAGPSGEPPLGGTIAESYQAIAGALVLGLSELGVVAELAPVATTPRERGGGASPPCFVSAGRFEVVVGDRKLIGSAQRRTERAVLQHGSLLTDDSHAGLADVLLVRRPEEREVVRRALKAKTTDLASLLSRLVGFDEVAGAVAAGFRSAWGVGLEDGGLSQDEKRAVETLATERGTVV